MKNASHFRFSWQSLVALGLVVCLGGFFALMSQGKKEAPATYPHAVLLIRHAEEPPNSEMSSHLSEVGKKRAEVLHKLFEKSPERPEPFPKPDFLIAPKPGAKSRRSLETLEPLAKRWEMPISADQEKDNYEKIVKGIFHDPKYAGKTILIAWNHSLLPALARSLKAGTVPMEWKESQYDHIWVIRYGPGGVVEFHNQLQALMPGDRAK